MSVTAKLDIQGIPGKGLIRGFEVVTNIEGKLWHYGLYPTKEEAEVAAGEIPERFVIEVVENG